MAAARPAAQRQANVEGRTLDVATEGPFTLGALARIVGEEREIRAALERSLTNASWFLGGLPAVMAELAAVRNPAAHREVVRREEAARWRNELVGVACVGVLVELGRVRVVR